ncbi:MAG: AAA family ATPase [Microthrixaceae bacterium]
MTQLVLVSQSDAARASLKGMLASWVNVTSIWPENAHDPATVVKQTAAVSPEVVVLGRDLPVARALQIAAAFEEDRPEVNVFLIASPTPQLWEKALRAGVRDILDPELPGDEVRARIERAIDVAKRRRANLIDETDAEEGSRVIVVLSPKGGAGKTTVACNLAVGLAVSAPRDVVLFDSDLQFGDVANALRLAPTVDFTDAVRAGLTDVTTLKLALTPHPTSIFALCASDLPADSDSITGEHVTRAIGLLREEFRYVVVDTDAGLGERTLATIDAATDLVFLCATDVPSVSALRKELEALDALAMTHQERHFVLNRSDARVGLSHADVQGTIKHAIDVFLPSSRAVPISMNQGVPLLEDGTASTITRALQQLVSRFAVPTADVPKEHRGGLRWRKES